MTQVQRVLALLRARGNDGLNTVDLHAPVCDGHAPIIRLAARIHDLQSAGYGIRSERKLNGTSTYFLTRDIEEASGTTAGEPSGASPTAGAFGAAHTEPDRPGDHAAAVPSSPPLAETAPSCLSGVLFDAGEYASRTGAYPEAA